MESQQERKLLTRLGRRRVLTTGQLAAELASSHQEAAMVARRLQSAGFLCRVRKGVYAIVPLEADPSNYRPDPFLSVQAVLGEDHAFSHHSALTLLGLGHQEHRTIHVAKPGAKARRLRVGNLAVHVHNADPKHWDLATTRRKRGSARLLVTTPERTLMDLLSLPAHKQDYDELVQVFKDVLRHSNHADVAAEGALWGTKAAQARLGHLLLHYGKSVKTDGQPFDGRMGEFVTLKSPAYFGTKPKNPNNRFDSVFNVVYPGAT